MEEEIEKDSKNPPIKLTPLTGEELNTYWNSHEMLKTVVSDTPISKRIKTVDGSIKNRNHEDETFLRDLELQERLRRGNTLIRVEDKFGKAVRYIIGRRGLPKFYDLRAAHVDILNKRGDFKDFYNSENKFLYHEWRTIISKAEYSLKEGKELTVYLSEKANGENAQVSYVTGKQLNDKELDHGFFIVCSKNVGIIFRNLDDINSYRGQRFSYAQQIARTWLSQFNEFDVETQDEIKQFLADHTLVGEYCGNKKLQHLVHYDKEEIIFYAVVEKLSTEPCLPFSKGSKIITNFGLPCVKMDPYPEVTSMEELGKIIEKLSKKVAKAPVEEMGEGSVLYIESRDIKSGERRVQGIGKLKTLDYRFWRKLREKLKNYLTDRYNKEKLLNKFKGECEDLQSQGGYDTCYDIQYYLDVAAKAVDIIKMSHVTGEHLRTVYLDFLDLARKCLKEDRDPIKEECDYFKYLSLEMVEGSEIIVEPVEKKKADESKLKVDKKKARMRKKVSFAVKEGEPIPGEFGMEEKEIAPTPFEKPKSVKPDIGANIIFSFPPGFIQLEKLEKYAGELDFKITYHYQQNKEEENYLRICLPSELKQLLTTQKLEDNDYILGLDIDNESLEAVTESEPEKLLKQGNSENEYIKSFFKEFSGTVNLENTVQVITGEARILSVDLKKETEFFVKKYTKLRQVEDNKFEYSFDYSKMDQSLIHILKTHRESFSSSTKEETHTIKTGKHFEFIKTPNTSKSHHKNEVIYIVFYGLSCIGKTYFFDIFQKHCIENSINSVVISSDECSDRATQEYQEKNPDATFDEAFEATRKRTNHIFEAEIKKFTKNINPGRSVILLDKVMNGKRFLSNIQKFFPTPDHEVKIIALYPEDFEQFEINNRTFVPFSASLILNLCNRSIKREEHLTVTGEDKKKIHLMLSFCLLYKNIKSIPAVKASDTHFHAFYPVSFHKFQEEEKLPNEFIDTLRSVLGKVKAFQEGEDECQKLVDLFNDNEKFGELKELLGYGDSAQWAKVIREIIG